MKAEDLAKVANQHIAEDKRIEAELVNLRQQISQLVEERIQLQHAHPMNSFNSRRISTGKGRRSKAGYLFLS